MSNVVRVPAKYSASSCRVRASNSPAGPRPSSSTHPARSRGGGGPPRGGREYTAPSAASAGASTGSSLGTGTRGKKGGLGLGGHVLGPARAPNPRSAPRGGGRR